MDKISVNYLSAEELLQAYPGDSGIDLTVKDVLEVNADLRTVLFGTGVWLEIPTGFEAQIRPRSSSLKRGLMIPIGTIDSGYLGEIKIQALMLAAHSPDSFVGAKIAQVVFCCIPHVTLNRVVTLETTQRGSRGFGSSGS